MGNISKVNLSLLLACIVTVPTLAYASCEQVAGKHGGRFTIDKREDTAGSGRPDSVTGTWTAVIDGPTCNVTGEATSSLTGTVALTGKFGLYNPDTTKFRANNLYMEATGNPDFIRFVFQTDMKKRLLRYVEVETSNYLYIGGFDGK